MALSPAAQTWRKQQRAQLLAARSAAPPWNFTLQDEASIAAVVAAAAAEGPLDLVFSNAGTGGKEKPEFGIDLDDFGFEDGGAAGGSGGAASSARWHE